MEEEVQAPEMGEEISAEAPVEEGELVEVEELIEDEIVEEELTIQDVMERMDAQDKKYSEELKKANNRTAYIQRKLDRKRTTPTKVIEQGAKPKMEDFDTDDEFIEELTDWKLNEINRKKSIDNKKRDQENKEIDFRDAILSGNEVYDDFDEKVLKPPEEGGPEVSVATMHMLPNSSNPVGVAYYLANNSQEARRIYHLAGEDLAREIGRIEIMVENENNKVPQKKTKQTTPSKPISGATTVDSDDSKLSTADWIKKRNEADGIA